MEDQLKKSSDIDIILEVGPFTIQMHPGIPSAGQVNVVWIENEIGEGMTVDLDDFWKRNF